jgi:hypothetical protein
MRIAVILLMVVAATRPFTLAGAENADKPSQAAFEGGAQGINMKEAMP